jgi:hypothetical protein
MVVPMANQEIKRLFPAVWNISASCEGIQVGWTDGGWTGHENQSRQVASNRLVVLEFGDGEAVWVGYLRDESISQAIYADENAAAADFAEAHL